MQDNLMTEFADYDFVAASKNSLSPHGYAEKFDFLVNKDDMSEIIYLDNNKKPFMKEVFLKRKDRQPTSYLDADCFLSVQTGVNDKGEELGVYKEFFKGGNVRVEATRNKKHAFVGNFKEFDYQNQLLKWYFYEEGTNTVFRKIDRKLQK